MDPQASDDKAAFDQQLSNVTPWRRKQRKKLSLCAYKPENSYELVADDGHRVAVNHVAFAAFYIQSRITTSRILIL